MKKFLGFLMSLIVSVIMSSCMSHDFETYDPVEKRQNEFATNFVKHYGEIASNQDWGFGTVAATRTANVEGNIWYKNWDTPTNVTEAERSKVVEEFSKKRENVVNTISISWPNYWVQQVFKGTQEYNDGNNSGIGKGSNYMNKLIVYNSNYKEEVWWPEHKVIEGGYEHVNNFNDGDNQTVFKDEKTQEKYVGTTLMVDMLTDGRTTQFGYHNSRDSQDHFEYIVLQIDGNYYVGFDFYARHPQGQESNKNMDVDRDWVFNDWIVKITPAYHVGETPGITYAKRIICEDLGSTGDWDFNDVVFDALIKNGKTYIKVLAAGGTMPLKVADKEVHDLFNVGVTEMVNTGLVSRDPVEFVVDQAYNNYNAIPVTVEDNRTAGEFIRYALKSEIGKAPQKICVGTDYDWCSERQNIENKYPAFKEYVGNPNLQYDWYREVE